MEEQGEAPQGNGNAKISYGRAVNWTVEHGIGEARNSEVSYCNGRAMYRRALEEHGSAMKSTALERKSTTKRCRGTAKLIVHNYI